MREILEQKNLWFCLIFTKNLIKAVRIVFKNVSLWKTKNQRNSQVGWALNCNTHYTWSEVRIFLDEADFNHYNFVVAKVIVYNRCFDKKTFIIYMWVWIIHSPNTFQDEINICRLNGLPEFDQLLRLQATEVWAFFRHWCRYLEKYCQ